MINCTVSCNIIKSLNEDETESIVFSMKVRCSIPEILSARFAKNIDM